MEEEKAAAYYDELTRKGEGAAKFKQGLGFSTSTSNDAVPKPGSSLVSSSSFLSQFVKASSSSTTTTASAANTTAPSEPSEPDRKSQLQSIQNKLKKKPTTESRVSEKTNRDSSSRDSDRRKRRSRSRSRERYRDRDSRRRSRSRERYDRYSDRDRDGGRSRSRSDSDGDRGRDRRKRERERERGRRRSRSRSGSPRKQRRSEVKSSDVRERGKVTEMRKGKNVGVDYAKLIEGYDNMAPAERVKAKMKLQLSETAARDSDRGVGWERFEFNKDAPLDDEEVEVAEDDVSLVKHIGQSFRFSAVESKREDQIQAAHDEAMFGAPAPPPPTTSTDSEPERESEKEVDNKKDLVSSLLSETVLARPKGSWRDRVRQA